MYGADRNAKKVEERVLLLCCNSQMENVSNTGEPLRRLLTTDPPRRGKVYSMVKENFSAIRAARLRGWGWRDIAREFGMPGHENSMTVAFCRIKRERGSSVRQPHLMSPIQAAEESDESEII